MKNYRRAGLNEGEQDAAIVIANQNTIKIAKSETVSENLKSIKENLHAFVKPKPDVAFVKKPLRG